jgi:hypothetical protein
MSIASLTQARNSVRHRLGTNRGLRLALAVAVVGAGLGATSTPVQASSIPWGTVLVAGSQWAGSDAGLGDLNVYSNGTGGQDRAGTFGLQYECTELAMRWAHYKFGEPDIWPVSSAADMWNAGPSLPVPLAQEPNGGPVAPAHGDIIVFAATSADPTGHVAVVSSVTPSSVTFVQQNFTVNGTPSGSWTQPMSGTTVATFGGLPVLGWLHSGKVIPPPPPPPAPMTSASSPSAAVTPNGAAQTLFWKGGNGHLQESWYSAGAWHGPADYGSFGVLQSPPAVAITRNGASQLVFWQGANNHLYEAWFTSSWNGPVDLTQAWGGVAPATSAPTVTTMTNGDQLLFWRGADSRLWEAWFAAGHWNGPAQFGNSNALTSAPSASVLADGVQVVFWQSAGNRMWESWFAGNRWNGPVELPFGSVASAPSVTITTNGSTQLLFWRSAGNHLYEAWYSGGWNGPVDVSGVTGGGSPLMSSPTSAVTPNGSAQIVFFEGSGGVVYETWWTVSGWNGPVPVWAN